MKTVRMPLPSAACPQTVPQKGGKRCPSPWEAELVLIGAQQASDASAEPHAANLGLCSSSAQTKGDGQARYWPHLLTVLHECPPSDLPGTTVSYLPSHRLALLSSTPSLLLDISFYKEMI